MGDIADDGERLSHYSSSSFESDDSDLYDSSDDYSLDDFIEQDNGGSRCHVVLYCYSWRRLLAT